MQHISTPKASKTEQKNQLTHGVYNTIYHSQWRHNVTQNIHSIEHKAIHIAQDTETMFYTYSKESKTRKISKNK